MIIFTPVYDDKLVCCVFIYNETTQMIHSSTKHYSIYNYSLLIHKYSIIKALLACRAFTAGYYLQNLSFSIYKILDITMNIKI